MGKAVARRRDGYTHEIEIDDGAHRLVIDEPEDKGGSDEGPSPVRVLASALAACTAITIEMYADRKQWDLGEVEVEASYEPDESGTGAKSFDVAIRVPNPIDEEQERRLLVIAAKCPVHRAIAGSTPVTIEDRIESAG